MKKIVMMMAAGLLVAGCQSQPAEETSMADAEVASDPAADWVGTYEEPGPDGKTLTTVMTEDGRYTESVDGEQTQAGTWSMEAADRVCFDPDTNEDPTRCFSLSTRSEDGTFTATADDGQAYQVKKVA